MHLQSRHPKAPAPAVAVTGNAGAGKTTVCRRFKALGAAVVAADELAREAVAPGTAALKEIADAFGSEVLDESGCLDRPRMREIITRDPAARGRLEHIVHPEIRRLMRRRIRTARAEGACLVVVEVPLLFEFGWEHAFDAVVAVKTSHDVKIRRLMARDQVDHEAAEALLALQMPGSEQAARADFVVDNDGDPGEIRRQVDAVFAQLTGRSGSI